MQQLLDSPSVAARPLPVTAIWKTVLPAPHEVRSARRRLHLKAVAILALLVASYGALVISELALVFRAGAAAVLALALVAVGTSIMHDSNHGSFSRHRWINRTLAYTSDALGASSWLWRIQHNGLHHGNTNVVGFDADIELSPWARLAPSQRWHRRFRWQHVYIWPLYGFLSIKNLLVSDVATLFRRQIGRQPLREPVTPGLVFAVLLGKVAHLGWAVVVPLMFNPWWGVLVFYAVCSWCVGFVLAIAERPAADESRRGDDFTVHQLRTTVDIASPTPFVGHLFRWVAGGLDHQIEHHLAPRLPHTAYPKLAARFRAACAENGIRYRVHPGIWPALCSHTRWLRAMGTRPLASP